MTKTIADIIIVGAGIVGLATAYQLLQQMPQLSVIIIEKEKSIAQHQTGHNSGVIHSGIYYQPNSHKARNCRAGYQKLQAFCDEHAILYHLCGKIIVATEPSELEGLAAIFDKGIQNGLTDICFLDEQELQKIEPHARALRAIHVPSAGIIDYKQVAQTLEQLLKQKGVSFAFDTKVIDYVVGSSSTTIKTSKGNFTTALSINCGGLYSDKLAKATGLTDLDYQIVPFRGEYYQLKAHKTHLVKGLIYPVPDPNFPFLGVHFTKTIHGTVEAGPNAVLAFRREGYHKSAIHLGELAESLSYRGFRQLAARHWQKGVAEMYRSFSKAAFVRSLQKLIPSVRAQDVVRAGAGVRAQALRADGSMVDDFLILKKEHTINVCNAPSPAATSSLEIGYQIALLALGDATKESRSSLI